MPQTTDTPDITIREMRPEDYAPVTRLWTEAGLPYRPLGRDRPEKVRAEMERGTAVFLVAEVAAEAGPAFETEDRIVGVVLGTHDGRRGWINRLAVAPGRRRQGIATLLVREVERRIEALGIDLVAALIETENEASLNFFRSIDYLHSPLVEYVSKRRSPDT